MLAATDMGHQGMGGDFGDDPQTRADFAYRAQHLTALAAKALVEAFYGRPAAFSYLNGCSDGGREALLEAQRFADDFDGIIAGAPAMNFQGVFALRETTLGFVSRGYSVCTDADVRPCKPKPL